jgi:hypothetical protein
VRRRGRRCGRVRLSELMARVKANTTVGAITSTRGAMATTSGHAAAELCGRSRHGARTGARRRRMG